MVKYTKKFIASLASLVVCVSIAAPAMAEDSGRYLDVTLIGDSYTAGNGAGSYYGPKNSYRSSRNWGHVYADWLNEQGIQTTLRNLAVSGGVTKDVLEKQIPLLDPKSDLVMLTIGGNDIKFEDIVKYCFVWGIRSYNGCEGAIKYAQKKFPETREQIVRIFEAIQAKVADDARIVLVGYPLLSIDSDYVVTGWFSGRYPAAQKIREFGQFATVEQQKLVDEWNSNPDNKVKVTFVPTEVHFAGHEPDPDSNKQNPYRWLNEMMEDEGEAGPDGVIVSKPKGLTEIASWYHPNITGHREIANLLKGSVGVPATVRTSRSTARDIDVFFLLETTQVTAEKLQELVAHIQRLMREMAASSTEAQATPRFGLLTYRDVVMSAAPEASDEASSGEASSEAATGEGGSENSGATGATERSAAEPPAANETGGEEASASPEATPEGTPTALTPTTRLVPLGGAGMDEALAALQANGPHARTSLFAAVEEAIAQFDRPTARKAVVVLGDLEAADADPAAWERLTNAAFAQSTAEVIGIDINGVTTPEIATLARRTGGYITTADTLKPLILPDPIAALTLPDLARVGDAVTLDGSESVVEGANIVRYEWDINGDGVMDVISEASTDSPAQALGQYTWAAAYDGPVTLRITDQYNRQASVEVPIRVTPEVHKVSPNPPVVDLPVMPLDQVILGDILMLIELTAPSAVGDDLTSAGQAPSVSEEMTAKDGAQSVPSEASTQVSVAKTLPGTGADAAALLALAGGLMAVGAVTAAGQAKRRR